MRWSYRNVYEVDLLKRNHYYYHEHGNIFTRIKIGLPTYCAIYSHKYLYH